MNNPDNRYNEDEEFQNLIKENRNKFPSKNIEGYISMPNKLISKNRLNQNNASHIINPPFGLFPLYYKTPEKTNFNYLSSIKTNIRTYQGKDKLSKIIRLYEKSYMSFFS